MRFAWLFLFACGTSTPKDPYAQGTCDASWKANGFTDCDEGCVSATKVLNAKGPACTAMLASGSAFQCVATFETGSATGCCVSDKPNLYFAECP